MLLKTLQLLGIRNRRAQRPRLIPRLVALEDRVAPATFTVSNLFDSGFGSLRYWVGEANATVENDVIEFGLSGTITLTSGEIAITQPLRIEGKNNGFDPGSTTINANGASRHFNFSGAPAGTMMGVRDMQLSGGSTAGNGGSILLGDEQLTLNGVIMTGNFAAKRGGGVFMGFAADLNASSSTFSFNTAGTDGGVLGVDFSTAYNDHLGFSFTSCNLAFNTAAGSGGAIYANYDSASFKADSRISYSCVVNNKAGGQGGGVYFQGHTTPNFDNLDSLQLLSSTVSGNKSASDGGGLAISYAFLNSAGSTITANTASSGSGGGVAMISSISKCHVQSSILSGNTNANSPDLDNDSTGSVVRLTDSALGSSKGVQFGLTENNLPYGIDLKLGALTVFDDEFGHLPAADSPVLNVGNAQWLFLPGISGGFITNIDQVGTPRNLGGGADIGAIERIAALIVTNANTTGAGSLRSVASDAQELNEPFTFDPVFFATPRTVIWTSTLELIQNFIGPGADLLTIRSDGFDGPLFKTAGNLSTLTFSGATLAGHTSTSLTNSGALQVASQNVVVVRGVRFTDNHGVWGGGIYTHNLIEGLIIDGCTFDGNSASKGGAVYLGLSISSGTYRITNSTFAQNTANSGGAVDSSVPIQISNSTFVGNSASTNGGALDITFGCTIDSCVITGNTAASGPDVFRGGNPVTVNKSLIGSSDGFTISGAGNLPFGTAAKLGPLADNGGPLPTMLPAPDSPLLEAGNNPFVLITDGRGAPDRVGGGAADIGAVEAQTFIVTSTANTGAGSFRNALQLANEFLGRDTIGFDSAFNTAKTISLTTGELAIDDTVLIVGPTAGVTLDAQDNSRVLNTSAAPGGSLITLSRLKLTNGSTTGTGGAILIGDEAVSLTDGEITSSQANRGGGAHITGAGSLILDRVTVAGNLATATSGGGIATSGVGIITVRSSTLSGNLATTDGGGIEAALFSLVTIQNSTISGNVAVNGGGLFLTTTNTTSIRNSTITANAASTLGGGIRYTGAGALAIDSTIVSGNASNTAPDISSTGATTINTSAIGSSVGFTLGSGSDNLAYGANLKLAVLADNGGPTKTHLPDGGSPVVNVGSNLNGFTTDQRGLGFSRTRGGFADIGAVEAPSDFVVTNDNEFGAGSLRQAVSDANSITGPDTITFSTSFFTSAKTITLSSFMRIIDETTIDGPGASLVTVSGNSVTPIFSTTIAASGTPITLRGLTLTKSLGAAVTATDQLLNIDDCIITANSSTTSGGGIVVTGGGVLVVTDTTVSGNTALSGGGIYLGTGSSALIERSTLSGNSASGNAGNGHGGGLHFFGTIGAGGLQIKNSTFSANLSNSVGGSGSAIALGGTAGNGGLLAISNSTITANTGTGAVARLGGVVTVDIDSSIVDDNFTPGGAASDFAITSAVVNIDKSAIGPFSGFLLNGSGNLNNATLLLSALVANGGPTKTHTFPAHSPLVNAGSNLSSLTTDQRGYARVINLPDIGASELEGFPVTVEELFINGGDDQRSRVTEIFVGFTDAVQIPSNAFEVRRVSDNAIAGITVSILSSTSARITFTGAVTEFGSLADGRYTLTIFANQISTYAGSLDGNFDGIGGDNYTLNFHRLFGDIDGNATVDGPNDFAQFGNVFGTTLPDSPFDYNSDGTIDGTTDFAQFGARFGLTL